MFCKKCGKEISEKEKFCSNCGVEVMDKSEFDTAKDDAVIRRIDCAKSGKTKAFIMIICAVFVAIDGFIYSDMGNDIVEGIGKVFIFLAFILAALGVYSAMLYQKRFCLLKTDSVCGVTCGTIDLLNENFEFRYEDVVSVQKKKLMQTVSVQTKYKKINIFLPAKELNSVYELLLQKTKANLR